MKREVYNDFVRKCFKTTEKYSLAVCGSFWGEKQFLLIFVPFYCFEQKGLLTTNPNFLLVSHVFKFVKKNKPENFCDLPELVTFWLKREDFNELTRKCFKTTKNNSLAVCSSHWGKKQFLLIFAPFQWFVQKNCLNKSIFSSWFATFQTC